MEKINVSIVLYNNKREQVLKAIKSCLNTKLDIKIYLIDNSLNNYLKDLAYLDNSIEYIFNSSNLGFGMSHNIALMKSIEEGAKYHLVLNPDVYFNDDVLQILYNYMNKNQEAGLVMPKILYPDGRIQYLCKLLPTPLDLFGRRFLDLYPLNKIIDRRNSLYELRFTQYNKIINVPYLSGSFMFLRVDSLVNIGIFDKRFFMYLEDIDLSRRIHNRYKTIYYPKTNVYHEFKRESYKDNRMLLYHVISAIKYFNKWGWIFDKERDTVNMHTLQKLKFKK